ncbi:MAG: cysteine desulfurase family protein [Nannocystaceae bacterium]
MSGAQEQYSAQTGIYLDHNATTAVHEEVFEAMRPWLTGHFGNASSAHAPGLAAARAVMMAQEQVAALIGAKPDEVLFTSGGTESNNLALFGSLARHGGLHFAVSTIEHPAVESPAQVLTRRGHRCRRLPVDREGRVDLEVAKRDLAAPIHLLSVMLAHNETGVVQPVAELAGMARAMNHRVVVHTDAAQAVGKLDVDVSRLDVDLLTIAGHKFCAPKGVGALYVRRGTKLTPLLYGGGQQNGVRPGTEAVPLVVGLGAAAVLAARDLLDEGARQRTLRERLWQALRGRIEGMWRVEPDVERPELALPNTLYCAFPGCAGAAVLAGARAVAASTGSACHAHGAEQPGVLTAMGVPMATSRGAVRLSLGRMTTEADVDRAARSLVDAWTRLGREH